MNRQGMYHIEAAEGAKFQFAGRMLSGSSKRTIDERFQRLLDMTCPMCDSEWNIAADRGKCQNDQRNDETLFKKKKIFSSAFTAATVE